MATLNYFGNALSDLAGGLGAQAAQQQQVANALTAGSINMGDYTTAYGVYSTDCYSNASSTITFAYPPTSEEAEQDDGGEESALDWLDRRVEEICAEL